MRRGLVSAIALTAVLMFSGCASSGAPEAAKGVATPKVAELIAKNKLEVVDYAYTKAKVADGTRTGAKALLIDARPRRNT